MHRAATANLHTMAFGANLVKYMSIYSLIWSVRRHHAVNEVLSAVESSEVCGFLCQ